MRAIRRQAVLCCLAATLALGRAAVAETHPVPACPGDCNFDGTVTVDEIVRGVGIALGENPYADCSGMDRDLDGQVSVEELIAAVNSAVLGCGDQRCGTDEVICDPERFCEFAAATCDDPDRTGMCLLRPAVCPAIFAPVCGCDGLTYGNDCERRGAGASLAYDGACTTQRVCGGFAGIPCPSGQSCELPAGMCDAADLQGICQPFPDLCPLNVRPVCGCDGRTYKNDCQRQVAGVSKAYDGACAAGPDPSG